MTQFPARYMLLTAALLSACQQRHPNVAATDPTPAEQRLSDGTVIIQPDSPKLKQIRVEAVKTAPVPFDEVVSPGQIETNPNLVARVTLPVPGKLTGVLVKLGDAVERGQPLLAIESPDGDAAQSAYLQAQAGLTQAKANLNKAQADYDRSLDLYEHNAVAKKDLLTAENALTQAKTALEQADATLSQTSRRVQILGLKPGAFGEKVIVPAPLSGKVLEISVAEGEYRNDTTAPVMTIADLRTVWVASDVPENVIRLIRPGERIGVTLTAYPGETFQARVTRIADTVDPQTHTIKVRAELDNRGGRLRPDMFCTIRHTESVKVVPVVPVGAVIQADGRNSVWVELSAGRFQPVRVETGDRVGDVLPVYKGLQPDMRVVTEGVILLRAQ